MTSPSKQQLNTARRWLQEQRTDDALDLLQQLHREHPQDADIGFWLSNALRMAGRDRDAEPLLTALTADYPGQPDYAFSLAFLYRQRHENERAAQALARLAGQAGLDKETLLRIVSFYREMGQLDPAIELLRRFTDRHGTDAQGHFLLARLYQSTGQFKPAIAHYRKALNFNPNHASGWIRLAKIQQFQQSDHRDIEAMRRTLNGDGLLPETRACLHFALGKALDDTGQYQDAWQHLELGNRLHNARWQPETWQHWVQQQIQAATVEHAETLAREANPALRGILITGLLRSGTTLLESILDRHADIRGRGELNLPAQWVDALPGGATVPTDLGARVSEFSRSYAAALGIDKLGIDKNPLNFRYLGWLIPLFPNLKIVHCIRDWRDCALSTYSQLFQHADNAYAYHKDHISAFYRGYRQLMEHWQQRFPNRIHSLCYEALISDPQAELRALLDWLEQDWTDDLLTAADNRHRVIHTASTWQARQALYPSSVGRWKHYRAFAGDWFDQLAAQMPDGCGQAFS